MLVYMLLTTYLMTFVIGESDPIIVPPYYRMYFYLAELSKMRDTDQMMRFVKDSDTRSVDAKIDETITDVMNFALRSLCSPDAQRNLNNLYCQANGAMDEEARCQALAAVDDKYPLKVSQKLPENLVYIGYHMSTINGAEDTSGIVGELGEFSSGNSYTRERSDSESNQKDSEGRNHSGNRYNSNRGNFRSENRRSSERNKRTDFVKFLCYIGFL